MRESNLHRRVVVVHHLALRRLPDQFLVRRADRLRGLGDQLPLRGRRHRDTQIALQLLDAVKRQPAAVLESRDHGGRTRIVLLGADPVGGRGREHFSAQIAAQPFELVERGRQRCHAADAHQHRGH